MASTGFVGGGAVIGKVGLGSNPLRTTLLVVMVLGLLGAFFAIREWGWLYITRIRLYMALFPAAALAFLTPVYRRVSAEYARTAAEDRVEAHRDTVPGAPGSIG